MRLAPLLLLPFTALALSPADALAQGFAGRGPGQALSGLGGSTFQPSRRPPPAALPGLVARGNVEPIPADPNANLPPTAALFDAISRGDIAAARDAVSRGADTEAKNVLGLTPLDAAVDQGRNDIMFFLLSLRSGRSNPQSAEDTTRSAFSGQPPAPPSRPERNNRTARASREPTPPVPTPASAKPNAPRLWANDGGAPNPGVGFLGFDAGRPARSEPVAPETSASGRNRG